MKKTIVFLFICCAFFTSAHEFWLNPVKFLYRKGEKANIRFFVGENFEGNNWNGNRSKINFLNLYQGNDKTDLSSFLSDQKGDSLQIPLSNDGTALIVYNGVNSSIELEAAKFNAYLQEDGLRETISYRAEHHQTDSIGREHYQRSVKTILQVGEKYDTTYKQATPLPLDIIPLDNPYLLRVKGKQRINALILFNKKPLADQLVKIWYRENGTTIKEEVVTDEQGRINFLVKASGRWMISTVKMIHLDNNREADWQSYWASCTWGYE